MKAELCEWETIQEDLCIQTQNSDPFDESRPKKYILDIKIKAGRDNKQNSRKQLSNKFSFICKK